MEFALVFFICPVSVVVASIVGYARTKRWFFAPILIFVVFTILTLRVFNDSFFVWVIAYTVLSVTVSLVMRAIRS